MSSFTFCLIIKVLQKSVNFKHTSEGNPLLPFQPVGMALSTCTTFSFSHMLRFDRLGWEMEWDILLWIFLDQRINSGGDLFTGWNGTAFSITVVRYFHFQPSPAHTGVIHITQGLRKLTDQPHCSSSTDWKNRSNWHGFGIFGWLESTPVALVIVKAFQ